MKEEWRDIPGYEGEYQASNLGRIKSLNFRKRGEVKILKGKINHNGYEAVSIDGRRQLVHRLVAKAFIPNPDNYPMVNHKDEVKFNNRADNLEWCDMEYNLNYGTARERSAENKRKPVVAITREGSIELYPCVRDAAEELKICEDCIYRALGRKAKTSAKRTWYYQEELLRR